MVELKNEKDLQGLRASGKILSRLLQILKKEVKSGIELKYLDEMAQKFLKEVGATSAFLGYKPEANSKPFPATICTSVNEQVVHGLPSDYILKPGDILKIDAGINYQNYITDAALTIGIPPISKTAKKLIKTTALALEKAISQCWPEKRLGDIGWAIESTIGKTNFKIIKSLTGHGVGFELHEEPVVYNYGRPATGLKLKQGMVLAIEPMLSVGSPDIKECFDGSFATKDKSLTSHFEKTVAITSQGPAVLTKF